LAVVGVPHPTLGAVVVGMLTDEADLGPARHAAMDLGAGRPRRWYVRADLPLTDAGKVDRAGLAAELAQSTDVGRRVGGSE
jgi:acyl-coenzyme A synthetase/AMP-(fatty) acid ligase